jgi:hypothetical protein
MPGQGFYEVEIDKKHPVIIIGIMDAILLP